MRVFLTGAAGLIGGEVAARLVARGHGVTGLVRSNPDIVANDRTRLDVPTIAGDIELPRFGWDDETFARVAAGHDLLIHCAASVRFDLTDAAYRAVNVEGTRHALELARAGAMAFLHVSTAYVCGRRNGPILESEPAPGGGFANGYEASKAGGEALVRASGLRYAIARPSIVLGNSVTGAIRGFDGIYAAFRTIAIGLTRTLPAAAGATLDFVPIDHVAGATLDIAERMEAANGKAFHLVSGDPLPVTAFAAGIGAYPQFSAPVIVSSDAFDPDALPLRERRVYQRAAGVYAAYFERDPRFDDANLRALGGRACPPTGADYLARLIEYCIAEGFLPAQRISG